MQRIKYLYPRIKILTDYSEYADEFNYYSIHIIT